MSDSYEIRRTERFTAKLNKQSTGTVAIVVAAETALAAHPYRPRPEGDYLVERISTGDHLTELHIAVNVYRMKVKDKGLMLTYTVREFEKSVWMEDLERSWRSQLGMHPE